MGSLASWQHHHAAVALVNSKIVVAGKRYVAHKTKRYNQKPMMMQRQRNSFSMRALVGVLFRLLVAASLLRGTSAANLEEIWNFSAPALQDPLLDPNGLRINIIYNVSDFIIPSMVVYNVSNWDCNVSVEEWFVPSLISPPADFVQGDGTGAGTIEVEINVDPDNFESATGDVASYWQQDSQERYEVKFCLFSGVQTMEENPTVVDSSYTQIAVTYDLTDGFALTLSVSPVRNEENAENAYGPEGFFCDKDGNPLTEDQKKFLGAPGAELTVCVIPNERARNEGFGLDKINEFTWVRTDENGGSVEQVAVQDGQIPGDGLTQMVCDDSGCSFVTMLKADFFVESINVDCLRPDPTWCAGNEHDQYYEIDCDGDGLIDQFCYNQITNESWLLSSLSNCNQRFGVASLGPTCPALLDFKCPRPEAPWCGGQYQRYYEVDCDGSGGPTDQYCYDMFQDAAWWIQSSNKGCVTQYGEGSSAPDCPIVRYAPIMSQLNGWMDQCGYCFANEQEMYNQGPEVVLDSDPNTKWFSKNTVAYIEFNFNEPVQRTIVAYQVTSADVQSRDPKEFALQVMTWEDQSKFVTLDTQRYDFPSRMQASRFPLTPFTGNIKTIRLSISKTYGQNGEVALAEFQVFEELVDALETSVERMRPIFWKTKGSMGQCGWCGTVIQQQNNHPPEVVYDGSPNTKWFTQNTNGYIEFTFSQPTTRTIVAYKMTTGDDLQRRDPKDFARQVMTWEDQSKFVTLDEQLYRFASRKQTVIFNLAVPFVGNIKTVRLWIRDIWDGTQSQECQLAEFQVFEETTTSLSRRLNSPAQVDQGWREVDDSTSGGGAMRKRRNSNQVVAAVSSSSPIQESRSLQQTGTTTIGGYGVATVKFGRRRYLRDLLTGEESWEDFEEYQERLLQVESIGGGGAFELELEIQQFKRPNLYAQASSAPSPTANVVVSMAIVAVSSVLFLC